MARAGDRGNDRRDLDALRELRPARQPGAGVQRHGDSHCPGARPDDRDPDEVDRSFGRGQPLLHRHGGGDAQRRLPDRSGPGAGRSRGGGRSGARRLERPAGVEARYPVDRRDARHADHLPRRDVRPFRRSLGQRRPDERGVHQLSARRSPGAAGAFVDRAGRHRRLPPDHDAHPARPLDLCNRRQSDGRRLHRHRRRADQVHRVLLSRAWRPDCAAICGSRATSSLRWKSRAATS